MTALPAKDLPDYDVVIATRNRPDALQSSLALILSQSCPPRHVFVVDSSDDRQATADALTVARAGCSVPVSLIPAAPGLTAQRNLGLQLVEAPIVFMPDDDSMWHPEYARFVLDVYRRDTERRVASVGGLQVFELPGAAVVDYEMSRSARWRNRATPWRVWFEKKWLPEPLVLAARERMNRQALPGWVDHENIVAVEYVAGYRMSFRTDFIRDHGFDEAIAGYALYDDCDASLNAWRDHLVLVDHRARVAHHQRPGGRHDGARDGFRHLIDYAYVVCKHTERGSAPRRTLRRWARYRAVLYGLRVRDRPSWQRLLGARRAAPGIAALAATDGADALRRTYQQLLAAHDAA